MAQIYDCHSPSDIWNQLVQDMEFIPSSTSFQVSSSERTKAHIIDIDGFHGEESASNSTNSAGSTPPSIHYAINTGVTPIDMPECSAPSMWGMTPQFQGSFIQDQLYFSHPSTHCMPLYNQYELPLSCPNSFDLHKGPTLSGPNAERLFPLLSECLFSQWLQDDAPEPRTKNNASILEAFLDSKDGRQCPFDNCDKSFLRKDRAIGHIRQHLNHRPFKCQGKCKNLKWYVPKWPILCPKD
ncbi:9745_t:CDS:2 [Acaulospora colombiana]|uniref:9745_t:CDS:1 n=1 Tax=Acaulospora colombiana TaxID=27376 RepID=A0ACA9PIC6_9GLOM|nr:9745_t:CDS:2 [Acaulospora colombiana]